MIRSWRDHAEAFAELADAAHWYENRADGLGARLLSATNDAIASILDPAITWGYYRGQRTNPQIYTRSIAGFPIYVVYVVVDGEVLVLAYAPERKRPGYWQGRLRS